MSEYKEIQNFDVEIYDKDGVLKEKVPVKVQEKTETPNEPIYKGENI